MVSSSGRPFPGSGRALRSTFPVAVSGSASSFTKVEGIMWSEIFSFKNFRNSLTVGAGCVCGTK